MRTMRWRFVLAAAVFWTAPTILGCGDADSMLGNTFAGNPAPLQAAGVAPGTIAEHNAPRESGPKWRAETASESIGRPPIATVEQKLGHRSATPNSIASLDLPNGNVVRFYVIGSRALVTEEGKAYTPPATNAIPQTMKRNDHLVDTWRMLAPEQPVPDALVDAENLITGVPRRTLLEGEPPRPQPEAVPPGAVQQAGPASDDSAHPRVQTGGEHAAATDDLYGCNNGCCDPNWLYSYFQECHSGDGSWFLFNYGWSWAYSGGEVWTFDAMACAAVDWSLYTIYIWGDSTWAWWIPESYYQRFVWYAAYSPWWGWDEKEMSTTVNDPNYTRLHTQCGSVWY